MSQKLVEPLCFAEFPCSEREFPKPGVPIYAFEDACGALRKARLRDSMPQLEDEPAAWATVIFRRNEGTRLQVGQSDAGWLVILPGTTANPTRISLGDGPPLPRIVFLLPEWTDLERTHVVPVERGQAALELWLRGGDPAQVVRFRP